MHTAPPGTGRSGGPSRWARVGAGVALLAGLLGAGLALAPAALAHPLGNSTVNQYNGLRLGTGQVVVDHVLDQAEIPTLQTLQGITGGRRTAADVSREQADAYRRSTCASRAAGLTLRVDGVAVPLRVDAAALEFPPGQAGLVTLRLTCTLSATVDLTSGEHQLDFSTANDAGRLGWREITAVGDRITLLNSPLTDHSITERLRRYPQDLLKSPSDETSVSLRVRAGGPAAPGLTGDGQFGIPLRGVDVVTGRFQELVSGRLTLAVGALGLLLSVVLGAVHALSPGHGKTIMAAFLVGQRGRWKQVGVIGLTVTVTHTIGVLVLGVILSASVSVAPQKLYPLLGAVSGLLVVVLGLGLLRTRWRTGRALVAAGHSHEHTGTATQPTPPDHDHPHDHEHAHPPDHQHDRESELVGALRVGADPAVPGPAVGQVQSGPALVAAVPAVAAGDTGVVRPESAASVRHRHGARVHTHVVPVVTADGRVRMPSLVGMGLADGLVPSPSALVVLLGAIALGRAWFGVLLVLGYGLGMAGTLIGVGLLLGRLRGRLERGARSSTPRAQAVRRGLALLPVLTSLVIIGVGGYLAVKGFVALAGAG